MKNFITLFCFLFTCATFLEAQIIFEERFEGGTVPQGWQNITSATDGGFKVGTPASLSSQYFPIPGNGSSGIAATNDDDCNCNKRNEYFISPPIDLSDQDAVALSFDLHFLDQHYQGSQEDASVEVSLDGVTWKVLDDLHGHGFWDNHVIDLTPYAGNDSVYIGFRYDDDGGWLYGLAIDNVIVAVPPKLEVRMSELNSRKYEEIGKEVQISGTGFNAGVDTLNTLEVSYAIDEGTPVVEVMTDLAIPGFSYFQFEMATPWVPETEGLHLIEVEFTKMNDTIDTNIGDNDGEFETEIFAQVDVPNKIAELLDGPPAVHEITGATVWLDRPTDLDFFPILGRNELWVINQRTENDGGSTLTISDATNDDPSDFLHRVDGNAWHFMSLPTALEFSSENHNFSNSPGVQDANHSGGTFTGPSLWSSDPAIYAQPSGGNGSHLDMLHGSPYSMGIAHEVENTFWVFDDWHKEIVRYDFVNDHGPGNDDHSDGIVRRYPDIGITADGDVPNHMILDKNTNWLYFVDNGNDRILRLDIKSGEVAVNLPNLNEPLAEHSEMGNFTVETIIDTGIVTPCGIEIFENRLLVGDYETGDVHVYDIENDFAELGTIPTGARGLTGIKIGPDGNLWATNRIEEILIKVEPGKTSAIGDPQKRLAAQIYPNPAQDILNVNVPEFPGNAELFIEIQNMNGQTVAGYGLAKETNSLNVSSLINGIYILQIAGDGYVHHQKIIIEN